jgi:hypothetical protein
LTEEAYPYGAFSFQNKKGHQVASLTGSMDLRGLFTSALLSSPPLSGKDAYFLGIALKYNHEQLLPHSKLNFSYLIFYGKSSSFLHRSDDLLEQSKRKTM